MTEALETLEKIVAQRRSTRAFLPTPVDRPTIERCVTVALQAPSNCNTQPWFVHIVSGETRDRLSRAMVARAKAGEMPEHDVPPPPRYEDEYRDRQIEAAKALFSAQGVERGDTDARMRSLHRNYEFFDAPHVALFCLPRWAGIREAADIGQCMQSFMLALTAAGIGSCAQGSLGGFSDTTRKLLDIPASQKIFAGVSFGYGNARDPACRVITEREDKALARYYE